VQRETAEPPDFNTLTGGQRPAHLLEKTLDGQFDVLVVQVPVLRRQYLYQFRLCHIFSTIPDCTSVPVNLN